MNGIKILIVDDEPELAEIVADQIDMMGYETSTFTDSVQAQEFLKSNLVDLIISDIRMPNGEACSKLKPGSAVWALASSIVCKPSHFTLMQHNSRYFL